MPEPKTNTKEDLDDQPIRIIETYQPSIANYEELEILNTISQYPTPPQVRRNTVQEEIKPVNLSTSYNGPFLQYTKRSKSFCEFEVFDKIG